MTTKVKVGKFILVKMTDKGLNLSQDNISYICKQPKPKQAGVALSILNETHSKNIVTMVNRFGNSIS